jgi:hypothetical protein
VRSAAATAAADTDADADADAESFVSARRRLCVQHGHAEQQWQRLLPIELRSVRWQWLRARLLWQSNQKLGTLLRKSLPAMRCRISTDYNANADTDADTDADADADADASCNRLRRSVVA